LIINGPWPQRQRIEVEIVDVIKGDMGGTMKFHEVHPGTMMIVGASGPSRRKRRRASASLSAPARD
jgi:hypothetical protein